MNVLEVIILIFIYQHPPRGAKWMGKGAIKQPLKGLNTTHWRVQVCIYIYIKYIYALHMRVFHRQVGFSPPVTCTFFDRSNWTQVAPGCQFADGIA